MIIAERISGLRKLMNKHQIDAYLITGTDPHLSEYIPERWETRKWISGFTGSYGKVLVTLNEVLLWTDTRYFLQAAEELQDSGIRLMKDRVPDAAVSLEEWALKNLKPGNKFAFDGSTISTAEATQLTTRLTANGIHIDIELDLVDQIWLDRPIPQDSPAYEYPIEFAGKSRIEKFDMVRKALVSKNIESTVITLLDDLAWVFNLRGNEIEYTPLVSAYGYLDQDNVWLFINPGRLETDFENALEEEGVIIKPYGDFYSFITRISNKRIQVDPIRTNYKISRSLSDHNEIDTSVAVVTKLKAVKDHKEIENIRNAHIKDGTAMVYSLFWLNQVIGKENITEASVGKKLNEFRMKQPLFKGDSFHPIVGFGSHGAIVHYHATDQTNVGISPDNLLLIDSGGQYLDGTTDITRTISLGPPTTKQREDFTSCLKAHIALATAHFPVGTKGYSLDSITRKSLWDIGINYGHGTGHGIGYFLSVHEGPMSIRAEFNNEPISEGHLLSNEPGIYREGEYGLRIENVLFCKKTDSTEFGDFLCFETVSLCPIDRHLIVIEMLSSDELNWLNHYHETVLQKLLPHIPDSDVLEWLKIQCAPLHLPD
ncbi:MAG: aminopeptidase P family protein [Bacteroidia bacterium]|nr:aminopeptidase P family protein [Bacteroidia bacterium]